MSMQDPISDMLTRIRNAAMSSQKSVVMPSSKMKAAIAKVLLEEGYIAGYHVDGDVKKTLTVDMKYYMRRPVIEGIERVSKPSCRLYCGSKEIPRVKDGLGIAILSSPKGIISGKEAKAQNVGGEILCYVW
ncbi:MAG: 30S ribosomal protein S8 [Lentisphaeria bacterium]|jgi:small subunit ribosomal protein S8|nr:30S ribosomal protein S8 [Lentisphaerota bacterium]MBQ7401898.1 30S ribosomal protein S8 [Lentisphaeria bacterium]